MIKPVLIGLSSSTTFIVFLMVFFIAQQGLATFEETSPIDFITGATWVGYYQHPNLDQQNISVIQQNYDFDLSFSDSRFFISPDNTFHLKPTLINSGSKSDNFSLSIETDSEIQYSIDNSIISLSPHQEITITISISVTEKGEFDFDLICKSETGDVSKTASIKIISQDFAFQFQPKSVSLKPERHKLATLTANFQIINTGSIEDTFHFSIDSLPIFRPSIREIDNWNYTSNSGTVILQPLERLNISVLPRMVTERDGYYNLTLTVKSENTNINDQAIIYFTYIRQNIFSVDKNTKTIPENGTAIFYFTTESKETYDLIISDLPPSLTALVQQENNTIFEGTGTTNVTVTNNEKAFQIVVKNEKHIRYDQVNFTVQLGYRGTEPSYQILLFIAASAITTMIAIAVAGPLGLFIAVFLSEFCPKRFKFFLRSLYDLLAGIPSVIYGFWGFVTLGPLFGEYVFPYLFGMNITNGRSLLTASFVLIFMILPIVIALSDDAIRSVEKKLKNGSLALGATRWQTMKYIIIPNAKSGIISSVILATGRAIGETMAVLMITAGLNNSPLQFPEFFFSQTNTLTTIIAQVFPWGIELERTRQALFAISLFLFIIIFLLNIIIYVIQSKKKNSIKNTISFFNNKFGRIFKIKNNSNKNDKQSNLVNNKKFIILDELNTGEKTSKKFKIINSQNNQNSISFKRRGLIDKNIILNSTKKALFKQKMVIGLLYTFALSVTGFLFFIVGDIIIKGSMNLKLQYFLETEVYTGGGYSGGFLNALVGSLQLVAFGLAVAIPMSIGAAIYINEYAKKNNIFTKVIMFTSDTLASTPSIVFGAFGFMFLVGFLDFKKSLFAGGITLGLMVIPLLLRSSIEAIKSVPDSFREGSYALGVSKWQTIRNVVIPPASPSISSGLIIGIGRAIGETAAILFTAGYTSHLAVSIFQPVASLPNMIYTYFKFGATFPALQDKLFSVAFLLIVIVIVLNLISKFIAYRSARMMKE